MSIDDVINILKSFQRYVNFINNNGFDEVIKNISEYDDGLLITMRGHCGETYQVEVYERNNELIIINHDSKDNILDIIDIYEYDLTDELLDYLKYGKVKV